MAMKKALDWQQYDTLKTPGLSDREIARQWGIPWTTFHWEKQRYTAAHSGTPATQSRHTRAHQCTPEAAVERVYPGTLWYTSGAGDGAHHGTLESAHAGGVGPFLSLLPAFEAMVARDHDRQLLLSTPIGTPRHTVKKTYVVDVLYVDLIER
jgi:hypothetical protein